MRTVNEFASPYGQHRGHFVIRT